MSIAKLGKKKNGPGYHGQIEVLDKETGITTIYNSAAELSKQIIYTKPSISAYFTRNCHKPYKGRYVLKSQLGFTRIGASYVLAKPEAEGWTPTASLGPCKLKEGKANLF
jgi:hypothetical protein